MGGFGVGRSYLQGVWRWASHRRGGKPVFFERQRNGPFVTCHGKLYSSRESGTVRE